MRPKFTPAVRKKSASTSASAAAAEGGASSSSAQPARKKPVNPDEAIDFFNRAADVYRDIASVADDGGRRKKGAEDGDGDGDGEGGRAGGRKKRKSEGGVLSEEEVENGENGSLTDKKKERNDGEEDDEDIDTVRKKLRAVRAQRRELARSKPATVSPSPEPEPEPAISPRPTVIEPALSLSPPSNAYTDAQEGTRSSQRRSKPASNVVMELDSDSEPEIQVTSFTTSAPPHSPPVEEDYFERLAREAREREARASTTPGPPASRNSNIPPPSSSSSTSQPLPRTSSSTLSSQPPDAQSSPVVSIFITTPLNLPPSASSGRQHGIKVVRRYLQNLIPVKVRYCESINMTPSQADMCFFLFNGQRVFERSSLKSIGVKIDDDGNLIQGQKGVRFIEEVEELCVVFELVNTELVQRREMERRKREERLLMRDEMGTLASDDEDEGGGPGGDDDGGGGGGDKCKITMKARGMKDITVNVTKATPISALISNFRKQHGVPDSKPVVIRFEGDELDEESTVEEMDIDDDEDEGVCVDVYVG